MAGTSFRYQIAYLDFSRVSTDAYRRCTYWCASHWCFSIPKANANGKMLVTFWKKFLKSEKNPLPQ
jgi:hypothetical protein